MFQKLSAAYRKDPEGFCVGALKALVLFAGAVAIWNATVAIGLCSELQELGRSCFP